MHKPDGVGVPVPGVEVRIMNEAGQNLSAGEEGQIIVSGENIMEDYWRDPAATSETIREGWLYTDDWGGLCEHGYLYVVFARPCCGYLLARRCD